MSITQVIRLKTMKTLPYNFNIQEEFIKLEMTNEACILLSEIKSLPKAISNEIGKPNNNSKIKLMK